MAQEADLEKDFVEYVEGLGGDTLKMTVAGRHGVPDRLCLLPGGRVVFAELKHPTRKNARVRLGQTAFLARLKVLGIPGYVIRSKADFHLIRG